MQEPLISPTNRLLEELRRDLENDLQVINRSEELLLRARTLSRRIEDRVRELRAQAPASSSSS
jgi:hypothetical protein